MNWTETSRKLLQLAASRGPRALEDSTDDARSAPAEGEVEPRRRALSLCIGSGKGGTGKSVVTASLAAVFAARGRTLVVDADFAVGNAHILQDVTPVATCLDVVEGRRTVRTALTECGSDLLLLAAGSGVPRLADLSGYEMHLIASGVKELEGELRYVLVDSAAGVAHQTLALARAADVNMIVTTPDLTAMTDAYAFLKLLVAERSGTRVLLLVNRARDEAEAEEVANRIARVGERFLGSAPRLIGWLPNDPLVSACVNRRGSAVRLEPGSEIARALRRIAGSVLEELALVAPRGLGQELQREVGYAARLA